MKVVGFMFLCVPGIVAMLYEDMGVKNRNGEPFKVEKGDYVYPKLVREVMPEGLLGIFLGILLGTVLSTFNSLNSASTMFGLEIYQIYLRPDATAEGVVRASNIFGVCVTLVAFFVAPLLRGIDGIFNFLQNMNTIMALPILTCFFFGIFTTKPDAFSGRCGFLLGLAAVGGGQYFTDNTQHWSHFLHIFEYAFLVAMLGVMMGTYVAPLRTAFGFPAVPIPYEPPTGMAKVDTTWWTYAWPLAGCVTLCLILLLTAMQLSSYPLFITFWVVWALMCAGLIVAPTPEPVPVEATELAARKSEKFVAEAES